jgi:uncharacterized BrkB/YihY/UPF0761 family membrane protein
VAIEREEKRRLNRERVVRTLTFWLRPEFVLRLISRFQKVAGFDRSVALASSALTAVIPLSIVTSAFATHFGGRSTADRLIARYELTGGGAEAVKDMFAPASGTNTSLGIVGVLFALIAVLSFTRAMQRLFEQTWELKPLSVRNTVNGLIWSGGLMVYVFLSGLIHGLIGDKSIDLAAALVDIPFSIVFLAWTGWVLSAKRIPLRALIPFALAGAVAIALYSIGARIYVPHLFSVYATRYGVIGAVFAMISALFAFMVVIVATASAGREIHDEMQRIRHGEKPAEDEVRRQWDEITTEARSRWEVVRVRVDDYRNRKKDDGPPSS